MNITKYMYRKYYHTKFEDDPIECCSVFLPCDFKCCHLDPKDTSTFCSEFVVRIYQALGVLDKRYDPTKITPEDFEFPEKSMERIDRVIFDIVILTP